MSLNKAMLIGRVGQDLELKSPSESSKVVNFSIATNSYWTDKASGNKVEKTEWHRCVAWNKTAELCSKYLHKGKECYIEGEIRHREYDDKDGIKRYVTEIVVNTVQFFGSSRDNSSPENK